MWTQKPKAANATSSQAVKNANIQSLDAHSVIVLKYAKKLEVVSLFLSVKIASLRSLTISVKCKGRDDMKLRKIVLIPVFGAMFLLGFLLVANFKVTGSSSANKERDKPCIKKL